MISKALQVTCQLPTYLNESCNKIVVPVPDIGTTGTGARNTEHRFNRKGHDPQAIAMPGVRVIHRPKSTRFQGVLSTIEEGQTLSYGQRVRASLHPSRRAVARSSLFVIEMNLDESSEPAEDHLHYGAGGRCHGQGSLFCRAFTVRSGVLAVVAAFVSVLLLLRTIGTPSGASSAMDPPLDTSDSYYSRNLSMSAVHAAQATLASQLEEAADWPAWMASRLPASDSDHRAVANATAACAALLDALPLAGLNGILHSTFAAFHGP